jgi:hypothetical protein
MMRRRSGGPIRQDIIERDENHCMAPGCTSRGRLEVHWIIPESDGGTDRGWNLITVCRGHQKILEAGFSRVRGRAPHDLYWDIGIREDGTPLLRTHGNLIIERAGLAVEQNRPPADDHVSDACSLAATAGCAPV